MESARRQRAAGLPKGEAAVQLNSQERAFLRNVLAHYRDTHCAEEGQSATCEMMDWYEGAQGHLERACQRACDQLIDRLKEA